MKENVSDLMREILRKEADAVMAIPVTDGYGEAVDLIVEHVAVRGGKLITSGMADSDEYSHDILFDRHSGHIPAPVGSAAWRPRHHPEERYPSAAQQQRQDP